MTRRSESARIRPPRRCGQPYTVAVQLCIIAAVAALLALVAGCSSPSGDVLFVAEPQGVAGE